MLLVVECMGASTVLIYGLHLLYDPVMEDFAEDPNCPGKPLVRLTELACICLHFQCAPFVCSCCADCSTIVACLGRAYALSTSALGNTSSDILLVLQLIAGRRHNNPCAHAVS